MPTPPGKDRWLATPISLDLSWPLTNRHLLGVASNLHYCVIGDDSTQHVLGMFPIFQQQQGLEIKF